MGSSGSEDENQPAEPGGGAESTTMALARAYIVRLKVTQISDDSNPDEERRRPQQDAAQVIVCEVLGRETKTAEPDTPVPLAGLPPFNG